MRLENKVQNGLQEKWHPLQQQGLTEGGAENSQFCLNFLNGKDEMFYQEASDETK